MTEIKVSIIIPSFNSSNTIKSTLASALSQIEIPIEVILIDDCSQDDTINIAQSFHDKRLQIIQNKKNIGPALSRNKGLSKAKGEWIQFLDADDELFSNKCHEQLKNAENADIVISDWIEVDMTKGRSATHKFALSSGPASIEDFIPKNPLPIHSALTKTSLIRKTGGFDPEIFHEDWEFWIKLASLKPQIKQHPFVSCIYFRRAGSKSYNKENNLTNQVSCLKQIQSKKYASGKKTQKLLKKYERELTMRLAIEQIKMKKTDASAKTLKDIDPPLKLIDYFELFMARTPYISQFHGRLLGPKKITRYLITLKRRINQQVSR